MTDQPREWRDEQGRELLKHPRLESWRLDVPGQPMTYLSGGDLRFLLKVLPEALGLREPVNEKRRTRELKDRR